MKRIKLLTIVMITLFFTSNIFAFEKGWVLNMKGNVGGAFTTPFISNSDLSSMGANKLNGMVGFVGGGTAEVGYIFDNTTYFKAPEKYRFTGLGVFGKIGVTQGYTGLISGAEANGTQVDAYVNVYFTPVITFGAAGKAYFFNNRLAVGLGIGGEAILDPAPKYEIYSTEDTVIKPTVGTVVVDEWMIKHMNPVQFSTELFAEYNVKILPTTELILGAFIGYNFYKPKYITMPKELLDKLIATKPDFDVRNEMKSLFMNSLKFGLTFGLGFRLD